MSDALTRRDVLKTVAAAGALAALPGGLVRASHDHITTDGWISGHMTGARALVETLQLLCVECVFGIPGAQNNELWDTMKSRGLPYVLVTHELSASMMADGYARATGKPGVIVTVPGPGVTNALTGIGEALLDSVPMVCIVTDVGRCEKYHPFQVHDLPQVALLAQVTKKVIAVDHVGNIPLAVQEAYALSLEGEPGPVAVVVPYPLWIEGHKYHVPPPAPPGVPCDEHAIVCALGVLADPKNKIGIYAGQGCLNFTGDLVAVAEMLQAPVATSVSGKGAIPDTHPLAVGWGYGTQGSRTAEWVFKHVNCVLAIGVRYSEVSTAFYSQPEKHPLVHVDANACNLGKAVKADVCVHADAGLFLSKLQEHCDILRRPPDGKMIGHIAHLKSEELKKNLPPQSKCGVDPMTFLLTLRRLLCPDALVYVDVTQTEHWAAEAFPVLAPRTYFNPTDNQAMGWSIPASIGGQRAFPGRQVVTVTGDGCFLMTAMEISTAARECLPVKFFILDDHAYHYMQTLQRAAYLRTTATILARIDYQALAHALGLAYMEIPCNDDLEPGIHAALGYREPILVRLVTDYGKRPVRWIDTVRDKYRDELSRGQQLRFLARMGCRAAHFTGRDPAQND